MRLPPNQRKYGTASAGPGTKPDTSAYAMNSSWVSLVVRCRSSEQHMIMMGAEEDKYTRLKSLYGSAFLGLVVFYRRF